MKFKVSFPVVVLTLVMVIASWSSFTMASEEEFSVTGTVDVLVTCESYKFVETDDGLQLKADGFGMYGEMGMPYLAGRIEAIAIPPGATVETVWSSGEPVVLEGEFDIAPIAMAYLISDEYTDLDTSLYELNYESVYGLDAWYPTTPARIDGTAGLRGYNLVNVEVTPFAYNPVTKSLLYYPDIEIHVTYSMPEAGEETSLTMDCGVMEDVASEVISNYVEAQLWVPQDASSKITYDYVIVTLDSLTSAVEPLKVWEEEKGRSVNVVTVEWIDDNYNGYDLAEKVRNFLREKYPSSEWGIEYVCIVGDYNDVPMRRTAQNLGYGSPQTDWYYAELSEPDSSSWDSDGDHNYGENSDNVDFYGEVSVGRIPWSDSSIVQSICEKSVNYEQQDANSYKKNILLLGAFFWDNDPNPKTDNAVLMEAIAANDWFDDWTMTRMYEQGYSTYSMDYDLRQSTVVSIWSQGTFGFVDWAGHGSTTGCFRYHPSEAFIEASDCSSLNDDYPAIVFADACSNGDTSTVNIGKTLLQSGGVGFVGATKVALGCPGWAGPYDGSSQSLDYFFTTAVTSGDNTQGLALLNALHTMYTNGLWDYTNYEVFEWAALLGNPDLGMEPTIVNSAPYPPATPTGPSETVIGDEVTFETATTDPEGELVSYRFDWGDGHMSDWVGPMAGGVTADATHIYSTDGEHEVRAQARDIQGKQSNWSEATSILVNIGPSLEVGRISGGFMKLSAPIQNIGTHQATNIEWTLWVEGGFVLGSNATEGVIESIDAGANETIVSDSLIGFGSAQVYVSAVPEKGFDDDRHQYMKMYFLFHKVM